jgi:transketolase
MASGSEVSLALETADFLKEKNISSRVVSIPDRNEFLRQDKQYIESVLGPKDVLRVVIEMNNGQGWYRLLKDEYLAILMETFGKSAPGKEVADYFGFTPRKIADKIIKKLNK